jgi:hypothetical protein
MSQLNKLSCGASPAVGLPVECISSGKLSGCVGAIKGCGKGDLLEVQFEIQEGLWRRCVKAMQPSQLRELAGE